MKDLKKYPLLILVIFTGVILLFSCSKDKTPNSFTIPSLSLWQKVHGHYKVYDTMGVYLYDMNIVHIHVSDKIDSLRFENFDGEFTFTVQQSNPNPNNYPNYISLGYHMSLYDSNHKRWKLGGGLTPIITVGIMTLFPCVSKKPTSIIGYKMLLHISPVIVSR